jgi:hypothetical protein
MMGREGEGKGKGGKRNWVREECEFMRVVGLRQLTSEHRENRRHEIAAELRGGSFSFCFPHARTFSTCLQLLRALLLLLLRKYDILLTRKSSNLRRCGHFVEPKGNGRHRQCNDSTYYYEDLLWVVCMPPHIGVDVLDTISVTA